MKWERKRGAGSGKVLEMGFKLGARGYWRRLGLVFNLIFFHLDLIHCELTALFALKVTYIQNTCSYLLIGERINLSTA